MTTEEVVEQMSENLRTQGETIQYLRSELNEMRGIRRRTSSSESHGLEDHDEWTITSAMRADPKFMLDPKNKGKIQEAAKAGRFV